MEQTIASTRRKRRLVPSQVRTLPLFVDAAADTAPSFGALLHMQAMDPARCESKSAKALFSCCCYLWGSTNVPLCRTTTRSKRKRRPKRLPVAVPILAWLLVQLTCSLINVSTEHYIIHAFTILHSPLRVVPLPDSSLRHRQPLTTVAPIPSPRDGCISQFYSRNRRFMVPMSGGAAVLTKSPPRVKQASLEQPSKHAPISSKSSSPTSFHVATGDITSTSTNKESNSVSNSGSDYKMSLQEIKDSIDIVTVIESFALDGFQRSGKGLSSAAKAICPFHDDRNPSLSIDAKRQMFKCFACGAGGDVFKFVQDFSQLPSSHPQKRATLLKTSDGDGNNPLDQPLSFGQAVQYVSNRFVPGGGSASAMASHAAALNAALQRKRDRILLANAAAAAYFAQGLTLPAAGGARHHVKHRGASLSSVRTFAIGYAPDVYFAAPLPDRHNSSSNSNSSLQQTWGTGSLVHRLRDLNFTPREILDSGLATRTKASLSIATSVSSKTKSNSQSDLNTQSSDTVNDDGDNLDYSMLIDRFRGRLMVPIFDKTGTKVLGFGGRLIASTGTAAASNVLDLAPDSDDSTKPRSKNYKPPKYLNSPESLVFEKKRILFGQNLALQSSRVETTTTAPRTNMPLVIVEGYMDAIALWDAGLCNVVATMGTAVAVEQLDVAAKTAGIQAGRGGSRLVFCMDNDPAGRAAVERLCQNGMLAACVKRHAVAILVASLPDGVKDPAEFIEAKRKDGKGHDNLTLAAIEFQTQVIETAVDWTDWYMQHVLVGQYNEAAPSGAPGSFSSIFDGMAEFFSSLHPADRIRRSHHAASLLCEILARERNQTAVPEALRTQLESDLIEAINRRVDANSAILRRATTIATAQSIDNSNALSALVRGHGPNSSEQEGRLSKTKASKQAVAGTVAAAPTKSTRRAKGAAKSETLSNSNERSKPAASKRAVLKRQSDIPVESLTPHFAGFQFAHDTDRDWINDGKNFKRRNRNSMLVLGGSLPTVSSQNEKEAQGFSSSERVNGDKLVYFNSVDFNGRHFLTDEARVAGYSNIRTAKPDLSVIEHGISTMVGPDMNRLAASVEDSLLRLLVRQSSIRTTVNNMLNARYSVGGGTGSISGPDIVWTCPTREWLFGHLVGGGNQLPESNMTDLRAYLSNLDDVPVGAFAKMMTTGSSARDIMPPALSAGTLSLNDTQCLSLSSATGQSLDDVGTMVEATDDLDNAMVPTVRDDAGLSSLVPRHVDGSGDSLVHSVATSGSGLLDVYFGNDTFANEGLVNETGANTLSRSHLAARENLATLMWVSAAAKVEAIRSELASLSSAIDKSTATPVLLESKIMALVPVVSVGSASNEMEVGDDNNANRGTTQTLTRTTSSLLVESDTTLVPDDGAQPMDSSLSPLQQQQQQQPPLDARQTQLLAQLHDATRTLQSLKESAKRLTLQLLDENSSGTDGSTSRGGGHISTALQSDLASRVDDFVREVCQSSNGNSGGRDGDNDDNDATTLHNLGGHGRQYDEPYEVALERMADEWGEWFDDEYVWLAPPKSDNGNVNAIGDGGSSGEPPPILVAGGAGSLDDDAERETLDEFFVRVNREWEGWDDA